MMIYMNFLSLASLLAQLYSCTSQTGDILKYAQNVFLVPLLSTGADTRVRILLQCISCLSCHFSLNLIYQQVFANSICS